jgi:hypothetical protein
MSPSLSKTLHQLIDKIAAIEKESVVPHGATAAANAAAAAEEDNQESKISGK